LSELNELNERKDKKKKIVQILETAYKLHQDYNDMVLFKWFELITSVPSMYYGNHLVDFLSRVGLFPDLFQIYSRIVKEKRDYAQTIFAAHK
jgi:hypothetical protein